MIFYKSNFISPDSLVMNNCSVRAKSCDGSEAKANEVLLLPAHSSRFIQWEARIEITIQRDMWLASCKGRLI